MSERLYTLEESFMLGHQTCQPLSPGETRSQRTFYSLEKSRTFPSQHALEKQVLARGGTWEYDEGHINENVAITRYTFEDGGPEILVFVEHTENENNVAHALAFLKAAQKEWGGTITRAHEEVISL